jgi:hypothetical protein
MTRIIRNSVPVEIELMRGGDLVSTLTGAFGQSLKETRLTALLGYLIALNPGPFLQLFGFRGLAQRVCLEQRHEEGRSDILVETNVGVGVIEAKVDATDPLTQSQRYPARWVALLTHRVPHKAVVGRAIYVTWQQLAAILAKLSSSGSSRQRILSEDLLRYMQEHHMTKADASVEIYAREINEPLTLALFLKAQLYGCDYQAGSRLAEALYFAPHFGSKITEVQPGIKIGISYIARIKSVRQATVWSDFRQLMLEENRSAWWRRHEALLKDLRRKWKWNKEHQRSFLLLGTPRLVFNPSVRKEKLQRGKGWLSKRFLSFDELFAAWGE